MMSIAPPSRPARARLALLLLVVVPAVGCSGGTSDVPDEEEGGAQAQGGAASLEVVVGRERVAALWTESRLTEALDVANELVAGDPEYVDFVNAARLEFALAKLPEDFVRVGTLLDQAIALEPDEPAPYYLLGQVAHGEGQLEDAKAKFGRALELDPSDYPTKLALANVLSDLEEEEEAERLYRELLAIGVDEAGGWHVSTLWRLGQLLSWRGDPEGRKLMTMRQDFAAEGIEPPSSEDMRRGSYGEIDWPRPTGSTEPGAPAALGALVAGDALPAEFATATGLAAVTLHSNWDREESEGTRVPASTTVGPADLLAWGPDGVHLLSDGSVRRISEEAAALVRWFDVDNDGDLDFLVVRNDSLWLLRTDPSGWTELDVLPEPQMNVRDVSPVDYDHEGDIDLLLVGDGGVRLFRNDGLATPDEDALDEARFTDATEEAGLRAGPGNQLTWCVIEDFDTDQDVDLLVGGKGGASLFDNLRGGVFGRTNDAAMVWFTVKPIVADLDGDAYPDLWMPPVEEGIPAVTYRRGPSGSFEKIAEGEGPTGTYSNLRGSDVNLDGVLDAVWDSPDGGGVALSLRLGGTASLHGVAGATAIEDFDRDGSLELAGGGAFHAVPAGGTAFTLALHAPERDNLRGLGSIVELRAGPFYRRLYWHGEPRTIGVGDATSLDIVRVTWPRGVIQHDLDVRSDSRWSVDRIQRIEGSCPFLYTWNGESYEFVTDVLGITPLGLPMAPGVMVPPDHDEYVLVRGEQMRPREIDGELYYDLQFTEELREVTYLDQVRLEIVDHPEGTEVFPNERFSFPPFPEAHTHVMRDPLAPLSAVDDRGNDWTASAAAIDEDYAIPFEPYRDLFTGLAPWHTLELEFDAEAVASAELLRLVCTGWFLWSDASINMLAARTPGVDFVPPILSVPDLSTETGWRDVGPPVGFPAGKRKTMVLDVTGLVNRDDPRIRISSTLCIYWDAVRLATDADDEEMVVTSVDPVSSVVWERGFSRSFHPLEGHMLEWFDWDELDEPRWNQHPGAYTKLGEANALVTAIDDRFAILGAGDALRVRFPADGLPPLRDGWRRDFLVFLDGWAKDRDPNAKEVLFVEPMPFHGMSGFPYGDDEAFPDTPEHRAWRREWNTRPERVWVPPIAPGRAISSAPAAATRPVPQPASSAVSQAAPSSASDSVAAAR